MSNVIVTAGQQRTKPQARSHIERISDPERLANDAGLVSLAPQFAIRIAKQFGVMSGAQQFKRQTYHLDLAAAEVPLRVYSGYSQLPFYPERLCVLIAGLAIR